MIRLVIFILLLSFNPIIKAASNSSMEESDFPEDADAVKYKLNPNGQKLVI